MSSDERQASEPFLRAGISPTSRTSSRRSSLASATMKTLKKIGNFPEMAAEEGDEYVFDIRQQVWRTREKAQPRAEPDSASRKGAVSRKPSKFEFFLAKTNLIKPKSKNRAPSAFADWVLLALLGTLMALISFAMDIVIHTLHHSRDTLMHVLDGQWGPSLVTWTAYGVILVTGAAVYCRKLGPQAVGSGIPEMKTIIRGVMLKEYLTLKTLIAKLIGLTLTLSSGAPVGKEGPFVHIGSALARQLSRIGSSINGVYGNESRRSEMLAAGCAVGVACTFSSPVGGVLYSIEATSIYFGMRNYKRCFLAATFSATVFRVLQVSAGTSAVVALYQTSFPKVCFTATQLPLFALLGLICGLVGALYVKLQRQYMYFVRQNRYMKKIYVDYWFLYPILVMAAFSGLTFPGGFGQYVAGSLLFGETVRDFFGTCSWLVGSNITNVCTLSELDVWSDAGRHHPLYILGAFFVFSFFFVTVSSTLPVPLGAFVPSFVIGGIIGRFYGEGVLYLFHGSEHPIYPGIYAVVGAAAFCGAVTHAVSVAIILYEVTGQLHFTIPILIGVLVAHATIKHIISSLYMSVIQIKKLPYLPDISHISQDFIGITADQFMRKNISFISSDSTLGDIRDLLIKYPRVKTFPICDSTRNRFLIGSCMRFKLAKVVEQTIGQKAYSAELARQMSEKLVSPPPAVPAQTPGTPSTPGLTIPTLGTPQVPATPQATIAQTPDDNDKDDSSGSRHESETLLEDAENRSMSGKFLRSLTRMSSHRFRINANLPPSAGFSVEERDRWIAAKLRAKIDLSEIEFDSAPFQLVDRTPLLNVHMIFSLMGLQRAYITRGGRLEGLICMRELRAAIENVKLGTLCARSVAESAKLSQFFMEGDSRKGEVEFKSG
uniref:Chloride channel protein n=1 Tax=Panagrellus redivivus TaxID=6233 RepID=A0A7E4UPZ1_PANRE